MMLMVGGAAGCVKQLSQNTAAALGQLSARVMRRRAQLMTRLVLRLTVGTSPILCCGSPARVPSYTDTPAWLNPAHAGQNE